MTASGAQGPALVWCPFPDAAAATEIAETLLDEALIACANIGGPMRSLFSWNSERGEAEEVGVLFKTDAARLEALVARLGELHPYDCPAILGWHCDSAHPATRQWLATLVS